MAGETFDPLRDAFNWEYGWSRPDDPARARPWRPAPGRVHRARAARRSGKDVESDPREEIGKHLLGLVAAGQVKDRAGVVAALKECGYEVPRARPALRDGPEPGNGRAVAAEGVAVRAQLRRATVHAGGSGAVRRPGTGWCRRRRCVERCRRSLGGGRRQASPASRVPPEALRPQQQHERLSGWGRWQRWQRCR